ncbi:hypothetical protein HNP37_000736 [Flavobacterium nitrogenifigens]|uniref:Uncharacterized protein n=2 Tax=Flavobacterium TaxID=237 RepID=A0A7W7IV24_9FLAO|nr:hypothetical protein [Flavobacterium nitrogenifigens]MBB6385556.1 hypothetical protein [Flavobacterium notoginsengisoli]
MKTSTRLEIVATIIALVIFAYYSGKVIGKAIYYLVN